MAGSSLLLLIDDIAAVLDDVATMTKIAAQKTSGVLGDDLALNAQQVTGVRAERELPVVWAVAKGSLKNKAILVPAALAISAFIPWAIVPLLMLGGAYLCFEGVEKLAHKYLHSSDQDEIEHQDELEAIADPEVDLVAYELEKIQGAVRTDFILSAEIITISLGTVASASFAVQIAVLSGIAVIMTAGVYGLVAGIVKMDDAGLYLSKRTGESGTVRLQRRFGLILLGAAPYLMKTLSVLGTVAMFMVGGGILTHGLDNVGFKQIHHLSEHWAHSVHELPWIGSFAEHLLPTLVNTVTGILAGTVVLLFVSAMGKARKLLKPA